MTTPKTPTTPPQNAPRAPSGSSSIPGFSTPPGTEEVIVQGRPATPAPVPTRDEHLSPEQLQDLSDASKTTGAEAAKPGTIQTTPRRGDQTHMIVRTRGRDSFRRGGLTFTNEPTVVAVADVGEERARQIEAEPLLEVRRVGEDEAADHTEMLGSMDRDMAGMSETELRQHLKRAHEHIRMQEETINELRNNASGADRAPRRDGQRPGEPDRVRR